MKNEWRLSFGGFPALRFGLMNLSEILSVLWHRKWVVVGVTALAIGGAIVALKLVTPVYEATSTMALEPNNLGNDLASSSRRSTRSSRSMRRPPTQG